ncbi:rhomboid family intramembrane serine protease [Lysobacter sp. F60174L2]|uniref:rhomboid family intramembrane serine protease n=1 Tax=Lysobacter sp. F60174L2 TaxID=3459295 RepID=UPI00403E2771
MHLPVDENPLDPKAQRAADRTRWLRAFNLSLGSVLVLLVVFAAQGRFDLGAWTVQPWSTAGLLGLLGAPLLHGSIEHLAANSISLLILGTLAGGMYPRATPRALPVIWLGSGLVAWLLGDPGSRHLGASGLTHGLMFLVFMLGLLRRDRPAIAAAMIAFFLYGGMLLTVFPREAGISWQAHMGGALGGAVAALLWRRADPQAPRKRYSWEIEEAAEQARPDAERDSLEPPSPHHVPVLWKREPADEQRGVVLRFPSRD